MKRLIASTTLIAVTLAVSLPALAAEPVPLVPADASFRVTLNPSKLIQSRLGQTILDRVRQEQPNVDTMIDELSETVGIDLRTALGQTTFYGTGYARGDFALVSDIGPTSGNINGLLLTAPGYESSVYREKVIVHSLPAENPSGPPDRVYCAMPKNPRTGTFYLVASFNPKRTQDMIDQTLDNSVKLTADDPAPGTLIDAWFSGLPELARVANADGPPSAIANLVQRAHLLLKDQDDSVAGDLTLTMSDAVRAQQVFELLRGGLAMMQLVATAEPQAQPLAELGDLFDVQHDPNNTDVTARFNCSYDRLDQLLKTLHDM